MANFDLKKFIKENKATFHSSLSEGKKQYYKDAEADDAEHIKALEKDMKDDKKSSKMTKEELKAKIKEMVLSEININPEADEISDEDLEAAGDYYDEYYDADEAQRYDEEDMPMAYYDDGERIEEADEEEKTEEEVDIDVEDPEPAPEEGEMDVEANADVELSGPEKEAQENLEAALAAAKEMGDEKLQQQIGNSLTFFTRQHIVK